MTRKDSNGQTWPKCGCGEEKLPASVFFVTGAHDVYICPKCGPKS